MNSGSSDHPLLQHFHYDQNAIVVVVVQEGRTLMSVERDSVETAASTGTVVQPENCQDEFHVGNLSRIDAVSGIDFGQVYPDTVVAVVVCA